MLNALLYTFILYHILFLIICDAFMCVHCMVFYYSATEALINNNNNNNKCVYAGWKDTEGVEDGPDSADMEEDSGCV